MCPRKTSGCFLPYAQLPSATRFFPFRPVSDESCTHYVHIDRYLFTKSLLLAAFSLTGRLLSNYSVMKSACLSIAASTSSWAWSSKGFTFHIKCISWTSWKSSWSMCVFDCWLSQSNINQSLTECRHNNICKDVLHYLPDLFFIVFAYLP